MPRMTESERDALVVQSLERYEQRLAADAAVSKHSRSIMAAQERDHSDPYDALVEAYKRRDVAGIEAAGASARAWLKENQ